MGWVAGTAAGGGGDVSGDQNTRRNVRRSHKHTHTHTHTYPASGETYLVGLAGPAAGLSGKQRLSSNPPLRYPESCPLGVI